MPASLKQLLEQTLALSPEDRAEVIDTLLDRCTHRFPMSRRPGQKRSNNASRHLTAASFPRIRPKMYLPMRVASHDEAREIHRTRSP